MYGKTAKVFQGFLSLYSSRDINACEKEGAKGTA